MGSGFEQEWNFPRVSHGSFFGSHESQLVKFTYILIYIYIYIIYIYIHNIYIYIIYIYIYIHNIYI